MKIQNRVKLALTHFPDRLADFPKSVQAPVFSPDLGAHGDYFVQVRIAFEQIAIAFFHHPGDICRGLIFPQSPEHGQGMDDVPERTQFKNENPVIVQRQVPLFLQG